MWFLNPNQTGFKLFKELRKPSEKEDQSGLESDDEEWLKPWPEAIVLKLKRWLNSNSMLIHSDWINLVLHRMFVALRANKAFRKLYAVKMSNRMNLKLKGNSFVSHVLITSISLGEHVPVIDSVSIFNKVTPDLAVIADCDIVYRGGASISIQTTLANGTAIPVQVFMNALNGTLRVRLPSERWADMIGYAFVEDPGISFRVESSLTLADNQMLKGMVNSVLSTILRKIFLELWVLPSWRTEFLPMLEPALDDWLARAEEDRALELARKAKVTIASRATQFWESTAPPLQSILKKPTFITKDCLEDIAFDVGIVLPSFESSVTREMKQSLVEAFIGFVAEPSINSRSIVEDDSSAKSDQNFDWKTIINKYDILVEKKKITDVEKDTVCEITRSSVPIKCDMARTFTILSNPIHFRHIYESFLDSKIDVESGDSMVHSCRFKLGKSVKSVKVFQAKSEISEDGFRYVVMRSIGGINENSTVLKEEKGQTASNSSSECNDLSEIVRVRSSEHEDLQLRSDKAYVGVSSSIQKPDQKVGEPSAMDSESALFLFGYHISHITNNSCLITAISQFSPGLEKLDVDSSFCKKLKLFIEELTKLTDFNSSAANQGFGDLKLGKLFTGEELRVKEKIVGYLSSASLFLGRSGSLTKTEKASEVSDVESDNTDMHDYEERLLRPKEICKIEILLNKEEMGPSVSFLWQATCKAEQFPYFSLHYMPADSSCVSETANLLPFACVHGRVLFPHSQIHNSSPFSGELDISDLFSGKIVMTWDNSLSGANSVAKKVQFRYKIQNIMSPPYIRAQVSIARKSYFSLPIFVDQSRCEDKKLYIEFSCGNFTCPFAVYFDQLPEGSRELTRSISTNLSDRLSNATSVDYFPERLPRKTIVSFSESKSGLTKSGFPIPTGRGVYTFVWDNSTSIVSTRILQFNVNFK